MRTRNKPWATEELANNVLSVTEPKKNKGKWNKHFNNNNPIHIEIGCGKGQFITKTSLQNPNINYVAIERNKNVLVNGVVNAKDSGGCLAFVLGYAEELPNYFEDGEISRIYINFCDPWQNRKKWQKRRLTHSRFLHIYENLFNGKGEVFLKTDNKELFEFSLNEFSKNNWKLKNISLDLTNSNFENIMTEYEEKFSSKGMCIYRCEAIK